MQGKSKSKSSSRFKPGKNSWFKGLGAKLSAYHLIFMIVLIISTVAALLYIEQNVLLVQGHENSRQLGNRIVAELGQRISSTETMTKNLAQLSKFIDRDQKSFKKIIPEIINFNGDTRIAGGGVWPEPFQFDPDIERRSFFWGREADGTLKYFDDYNDMNGPGYHHEEWYVPARHLQKDQVYWSKSYMDPYSYEPMVTCTAPIFEQDKFIGVSTIDLKLTGLDEFFKEKVGNSGGYIFAVDRNNKLLSYPDKKSAKIFHKEENGKIAEEFMSLTELKTKFPDYQPLEQMLKSVNHDLFNSPKHDSSELKKLSHELTGQSYQIDIIEAQVIAAYLLGKLPMDESKIQIRKDPVLKKQAMVYTFTMPSTGWKILVVTPLEKVNAFAREITFKILKVIIFLELIILLLMLLVLSKVVTNPLASMSDKLNNISDLETEEIILSEENRADEIGYLAHEFNKRSEIIKQTIHKLKEGNLALEERVKMRTEDIELALKQVEEAKTKAEAANKSKSHFLANMSHEIRTPMNAILGYTDLLFKEVEDPKLKNFIITIKNSGQSLLTLINDILDLSKVEAGKVDLQLKASRIDHIFRSVVDQFSDIALKKEINLNLKIDKSIPQVVKVDSHRVGQILNNLVGNAVKFIKQGEVRIHLVSYTDNKSLIFSVKDEGPGIPEDKLDQIFEDFEQADNVEAGSGTGLGLAITKRLVELMDGTITVTSKVGKGSEFTVTLKNVEIASLENVDDPKVDIEYIFKKAKILIADDIENNINLLLEYLGKYPFKIYTAANGLEAVKQSIDIKPDLILMDMKMPEMDGFTASKKIKSHPATRSIPIVAVTAAAMKSTEKEVRELCDGFLKKPIREDVLIKEIASFLNPKTRKKSKSKYSVTTPENAGKILDIITREFIEEIIRVSDKREITDFHSLIKKLKGILSDYPSHILSDWVDAIQNAMDDFDMDLVQTELKNVYQVMKELKDSSDLEIS